MEFEEENEIETTGDDGEIAADVLKDAEALLGSINEDDYEFEIPKASKVILYHGNSLSDNDWMRQRIKSNIVVEHFHAASALREPYKFMSAKLVESNEALNDYLDDFVFEVKARCRQLCESEKVIADEELRLIANDLADEETLMTQFTTKTAIETYYIGRIRFNFADIRLNNHHIYLESSTSYCNGDVLPLDLSLFTASELSAERLMSLFPGQIVIMKGQNPNGNFIRVTHFVDLAQLFGEPKFCDKCPAALHDGEPINIVCASGPFVPYGGSASKPIDMTDTTHIRALANYVKHYNPNVLLLFGPVYDEAQTESLARWSLQESMLTEDNTFPYQWTIERLFNHQFRALSKELEGLTVHTQIVFIPSANELGTANIFPTSPIEIKQILPIQSYSNPVMISIGGVCVGAISTDILLHMSRNEISNISKDSSDQKNDRLKRLCTHILDHRNFYPLLPADRSVNLEYSMFSHLKMPIAPNLLIAPSVLRPFIYNVNDTITINPGRMVKNTIARIMIEPLKNATAYTGSISDYINAEIIKLIVD